MQDTIESRLSTRARCYTGVEGRWPAQIPGTGRCSLVGSQACRGNGTWNNSTIYSATLKLTQRGNSFSTHNILVWMRDRSAFTIGTTSTTMQGRQFKQTCPRHVVSLYQLTVLWTQIMLAICEYLPRSLGVKAKGS